MAALREQVITAIHTKDREQYEQLAKKITKEVGAWDRQGRYTINPEFATHTSAGIRTPSRAWPKSEYEHAQTRKYLTALTEKNQWLEREKLTSRHQQTIGAAKAAQLEVAL